MGFKFFLACTTLIDDSRFSKFLLPDLYKGLHDSTGNGLCVTSFSAIETLLANLVQIVLAVAGLAAVGVVMFAGFTYITSNGNAAQITKAKDTLINWVIGLLIIIGAYAIVGVVAGALH